MPSYEYTLPVSKPDVQWLWGEVISSVSADLISITTEDIIVFVFAQNLDAGKLSSLDSAVANCPSESTSRTLTKWAFRSRFTFEERMLLDNSTNPAVVVLRNDLSSAEYVNLDDPSVSQGFDLLIYNNIITPTRKSEILT